jgi:hypothetical protein
MGRPGRADLYFIVFVVTGRILYHFRERHDWVGKWQALFIGRQPGILPSRKGTEFASPIRANTEAKYSSQSDIESFVVILLWFLVRSMRSNSGPVVASGA